MRDTTKEEKESVDKYVKSISIRMIPMSVIEDIKAEIKSELITHGQVIEGEYFSDDAGNINFGLNKALKIIDKHLADMRGKADEIDN